MYNCNPERNEKTGIMTIESENVVFHCNHYNRFLQLIVEDCHYIKKEPILLDSAAEISYRQFSKIFQKNEDWDIQQKLECAETIYRFCGFGDLHLLPAKSILEKNPIVVSERHSHYGEALRLNYGKRTVPGEFFDLGYAIGAISASINQRVSGRIASRESDETISMGGGKTNFYLSISKDQELFSTDFQKEIPYQETIADRSFALHINEEEIIHAVSSMPLFGNENGLIPAFGVHLTRHYADYYNLVSFRFEKALEEALNTHKYLCEMLWYEYPSLFFYKEKFVHLQGKELAKTLLIEAGHICGFNTMGGIMRSDPWYQLVVPQLRKKEDWIAGIVACINALGWGIWRIAELKPNERLVMRAWYPYESLGHLRIFGKADHPVDYLMAGVCASLMNLLYTADITEKPDLTLDFYYKANRSRDGFWGTQTRCVAMGDEYSEIVVERNII